MRINKLQAYLETLKIWFQTTAVSKYFNILKKKKDKSS